MRPTYCMLRCRAGFIGIAAVWMAIISMTPIAAQQDSPRADSQSDPKQILQESLQRSNLLDGYTIPFYLRERTEPFDGMSPWSHVKAYYRKQPLAVKFVWLNSNSDFKEAVYVEGRDEGNMKAQPRRGFLGLPPRTVSVKPEDAVWWGKTLRPITDFGLGRLIELTLQAVEDSQAYGDARVEYAGQVEPPDLQEKAHHIIVSYPDGFADSNRQDLYISTRTGYPIATYFWRADGELLATYLYGKPDPPAPALSEFQLSNGRTASR